MNLRGAFEHWAFALCAGRASLGGAAPGMMPFADGPEVGQAMVLAVPDVVTLKKLTVPAAPAVSLDDDATVTVAQEHQVTAFVPVRGERDFPRGPFPSHG